MLPPTVWLLALSLGPTCGSGEPVCTPVEKWRWQGLGTPPAEPFAATAPLVLELTDDNGDGRIDPFDRPDVAFIAAEYRGQQVYGFLTVLDAATGIEHFTVGSLKLNPWDLAAADLDGDGVVELLAIDGFDSTVHCFEHTGALRWTSSSCEARNKDVISIADLDQDGHPEVIAGPVVLDRNGAVLWSDAFATGDLPEARIASVVELDPASPGLEVLFGHTLYDARGAVLWDAAPLPDGFTAIADLDGDGAPEVVLTSESDLFVLDRFGTPLGPAHSLRGTRLDWLSPPAIADIDGDGLPEIIAIQSEQMEALGFGGGTLSVKWVFPVLDWSRAASASFYDFNGDGAAEVLYHDEASFVILDGRTGRALFSTPVSSETGWEYPVVAELDGDCDAEILVTGGRRPDPSQVIAYDCAPSLPPRGIWNQLGYHVTSVEDDGRIPAVETPPWIGQHGWHEQTWDASRAGTCPSTCTPPAVVTGLLAVRRGGDAALIWSLPPTSCGFNVWYVHAKTLIDQARLGGIPPPAGVTGCSPLDPARGPDCTDMGAVGRGSPVVYYYQVRALCDARTEGQ